MLREIVKFRNRKVKIEKFHKFSKKMEGTESKMEATESKLEFKDIVKKQWILKQLESIGK